MHDQTFTTDHEHHPVLPMTNWPVVCEGCGRVTVCEVAGGALICAPCRDHVLRADSDDVEGLLREHGTPENLELLPEVEEDTSEEPCTDHGFDACPDCGNGGIKMDSAGCVPCTRFLTCWADLDDGTEG